MLYQGCQLLPPPPSRHLQQSSHHQSRFLSALFLIFIFPQNFNYLMARLSLSPHSFTSLLLLTAQLLFFAMWFQGADLLYSFMCTSLSESLIFLFKRGKRKALSHRQIAFTHFLLVSSRWNANTFHGCSASFFPNLFLFSHLFYVQGLIVCCKTGINHNNAYDK